MDFDQLEKDLKKKHKKYFWSSALYFSLMIVLIIVGLFFGAFFISILSLGFVVLLFYLFVRSVIGMFQNHNTLVDIWDEKIFFSESIHGKKDNKKN